MWTCDKLLVVLTLTILGFISLVSCDEVSVATMRKLCEMPEFQEAMAQDEELEPAAVVYEVMTQRLAGLESKILELENRLEISPTHDDVRVVAEALKAELLDHVDDRMSTLAEDLERNVHEIIRNLMNNLSNLGYEAGFEMQTLPPTTTTEAAIKDCDYLASHDYKTGVHALQYSGETVEGYCEFKGEHTAWLVIQKRQDGTQSFFKNYQEYADGFGDLMGEFYFGNEKIHMITNTKSHMLRIEMEDVYGDVGFAEFSNFSLSAASDGYRLSYDAFLGGVVGDSLKKSQGVQFSTYDKDQDDSQLYSCARLHRGGFWYDRCGSANLNGVYSTYDGPATFNWQNIFWYTWKRDLRSLKSVSMMIRPSDL